MRFYINADHPSNYEELPLQNLQSIDFKAILFYNGCLVSFYLVYCNRWDLEPKTTVYYDQESILYNKGIFHILHSVGVVAWVDMSMLDGQLLGKKRELGPHFDYSRPVPKEGDAVSKYFLSNSCIGCRLVHTNLPNRILCWWYEWQYYDRWRLICSETVSKHTIDVLSRFNCINPHYERICSLHVSNQAVLVL